MKFALRGLDEKADKGLQTIAAFRMPTSYDTLAAVLVGENKACATEPEFKMETLGAKFAFSSTDQGGVSRVRIPHGITEI